MKWESYFALDSKDTDYNGFGGDCDILQKMIKTGYAHFLVGAR